MRTSIFLAAVIFFSFRSGAQNNALNFNGTNQYAEINDNNAIDLSSNFSLEVWINPAGPGSSVTEGGMILNKENSYEIARFADGTIRYALSANGTGTDWAWINTNISTPQNQWSHIAFVKSGTSITVYLNGISLYTNNTAPANLTANSQNMRIAHRGNLGNHYFNGRIDELRIWNIAISQVQVKNNMFKSPLVNTAGLVAIYKCDAGSGTAVANSSANSPGAVLNGVLSATTAWGTSQVVYAGNALNFDGLNDYVTVPDNNNLDLTNTFTIECWLYAVPGTSNTIQNVVSKSQYSGSPTFGSNNSYIFPRTDDDWVNLVVYLNIGGWQNLSTPYTAYRNAWHHVAFTYDAGLGTNNMKLFIDGSLVAQRNQTGSVTVNANTLTIGNQHGYSEWFRGSVDEIRIWNVARTATQISDNRNKELNPATQTGLVSYYNFNQGIPSGDNSQLLALPDRSNNNNGTLIGFGLTTGSTTNFITQPAPLVILPVNWHSFNVREHDHTALLDWSTASEYNTKDFTVQHSADGINWVRIGTVAASGNSNQVVQYNYTHNNPVTGVNFYRLLQNDLDGRSTYSETRKLVIAGDNKLFVLSANNPVLNGSVQVTVLKPIKKLSLYNSAGKLVWEKNNATGTERINTSNFAKGVYILISGGQTEKIVL